MASKNPSQGLFQRHKIFSLIFSFLFLALLANSAAIIQQKQVYKSRAAETRPTCGLHFKCPAGKSCNPSGLCLNPGECWTQADCVGNTKCDAQDGLGHCYAQGR